MVTRLGLATEEEAVGMSWPEEGKEGWLLGPQSGKTCHSLLLQALPYELFQPKAADPRGAMRQEAEDEGSKSKLSVVIP